MSKHCAECIYNDNNTCHHNSPSPSSGNAPTNWPPIKGTDWCAQGYNHTDGFYDPMKSLPSGP